jgi:hypothetical protein
MKHRDEDDEVDEAVDLVEEIQIDNIEDDDVRRCAICSVLTDEVNGSACLACDEWVCTSCWTNHHEACRGWDTEEPTP